MPMGETHTGSSLLYFLRDNAEDRDDLNHDLDDDVYHSLRRSDLYVCFKPLEKVFHTAKKIDESVFACADILNSLKGKQSQNYLFAGSRKVLTWRRTPIPVNIAFAGGNICGRTRQRDLERYYVSEFTTLAPFPRVAENANNTLTVGSSHFIHLSSEP